MSQVNVAHQFYNKWFKTGGYMRYLLLLVFLINLWGCSGDDDSTTDVTLNDAIDTPFSLQFKATFNDLDLLCTDLYDLSTVYDGLNIGLSDLRFFISDLVLIDTEGNPIEYTLDSNSFQLTTDVGTTSLIDFLGNTDGYCANRNEATSAINTAISGVKTNQTVSSIAYEVGVSQPVMQKVKQTYSQEDAPAPLNQLYWSWAGGYRHFVASFVVMDATHTEHIDNGAIHIGSRDCGATAKALENQNSCGFINTPTVALAPFDLETNIVEIKLEKLFNNTSQDQFISPILTEYEDESVCINDHRHHGKCVTGMDFGFSCHANPSQSGCAPVFENLGLDIETGLASPDSNTVFTKR